MAKFTHNGKTYDTKKRTGGMSEREYIASITGKSKENASTSLRDKIEKTSKDTLSTAKKIESAAPVNKDPVADFNEGYSATGKQSALYNADMAQAEATFKPFYTDKIESLMEDLKSTEQMSAMSYSRSLRRARFAEASLGGAIGTGMDEKTKSITDQQQYEQNDRLKTAERAVGTQKLQESGFKPVLGHPSEGSIYGEMKSNIASEQLKLKDISQARYLNDASKFYQS